MSEENFEEGSAGAAPTTRQPVVAPARSSGVTINRTQLEIVTENMRSVLADYVKQMAPNKAITVEEGTEQQYRLLKVLKNILALPVADFQKAYDELLQQVLANRNTVFQERYAFRFQAHMLMSSKEDRLLFERLLNLVLMTCDPKDRQQVLSRYDWKHLQRSLEGSGAAEKLTVYYQM